MVNSAWLNINEFVTAYLILIWPVKVFLFMAMIILSPQLAYAGSVLVVVLYSPEFPLIRRIISAAMTVKTGRLTDLSIYSVSSVNFFLRLCHVNCFLTT